MKSIKKVLFALIAVMVVALACFGVGCQSSGCNKKEINFALDETKLEVNLGLSAQLKVVSDEEYEDLKFKSSNPDVATVNERTGYITTLSAGTTEIIAYVGKKEVSCTVKVVDKGEIPHIEFEGIDKLNGIRMLVGNNFSFNPQVYLCGKLIEGIDVKVERSSSVITVTNGVITANRLGTATVNCSATYLDWEFNDSFTVNVVENIDIRLNQNNVVLCYENAIGKDYEVEMGIPTVYKDGKAVSATINWKSDDETIATIDDSGKLIGKKAGKTVVRAEATVNNVKYSAYANVSVVAPKIDTPTNFRYVENLGDYGSLVWDKVENASSYQVFIGANSYMVSADKNEYALPGLFGQNDFRIIAKSDMQDVLDSETSKLLHNFLSKDYEKYIFDNQTTTFESSITVVNDTTNNPYNDSVLNDEKIYFANCTNKDYSFGLAPNGGVFKIIYITEATERWGDKNRVPFRDELKTIITSTESASNYVGGIISFWAYSYNQDLKFSYAKTTGASGFASSNGSTVIAEFVVPANKWTRVMISISDGDFSNTMYNVLDASTPFYFADFRICSVDYQTTDYSECGFYLGYDANSLIDNLPTKALITPANYTQYKEQIANARKSYDNFMNNTAIADADKGIMEANCHEVLTNCEGAYAMRLIEKLPSITSYSDDLYNSVKSVRDYYTSLDDLARSKVENSAVLIEAEKLLFNYFVESKTIAGTYTITNSNASSIINDTSIIRTRYNELASYTYVENNNDVNPVYTAIGNIETLLTGEEKTSTFVQQYVRELSAKENSDKTIAKSNFKSKRTAVANRYEEIKNARSLFNALSTEAKELIAYFDKTTFEFISSVDYKAKSNTEKKKYTLLESLITDLETKYDKESYSFVKEIIASLAQPANMKLSGKTIEAMQTEYDNYSTKLNNVNAEYNALATATKNKLAGEYILGSEKYSDRLSSIKSKLEVLKSALDNSIRISQLQKYDGISDKKEFFDENIDEVLSINLIFNALSSDVSSNIPSWVKSYLSEASTSAYQCGKYTLVGLIDQIPEEITLDNVGFIEKAQMIYENLDEESKSSIVAKDRTKLNNAISVINAKFTKSFNYAGNMTVYEINFPWTSYSDVYRAKGSVAYDYDSRVGDVAKVHLEYDETTKASDPSVSNNAAFRFDTVGINTLFAEHTTLVAVQFYVRTDANTDLYLARTKDDKSYTMYEDLTIKTFGSNGEWVPVLLTREQFQELNGVIFKSGFISPTTPHDVYLSNFFLIYANEYVKDLVAGIEALNINKDNYLDNKELIVELRSLVNGLNDESFMALTNVSKLEEIETNIVVWDIEALTEPGDMLVDNYETLEKQIANVRKEYDILSISQKNEINNYAKLEVVESTLYSLKPGYIMNLINALPTTDNLVFNDDKTIDRIAQLYAELSEDDRYEVTNYQTFKVVNEYYYSHWVKVFDNDSPWIVNFANSQERARLGCDSYRGKFISANVVDDETYGKVSQVIAMKDESSSTGMNFSAKFDVSKVEELMTYYGVEEVTFYVKVRQNRIQINDGNSQKKYDVVTNEWTEIKLSKDMIVASSGAISSDWLLSVSNTEYEFLVSNFYLVIDE